MSTKKTNDKLRDRLKSADVVEYRQLVREWGKKHNDLIEEFAFEIAELFLRIMEEEKYDNTK